MFRVNSSHKQISLFETTNFMNKALLEKLENSWAPTFYTHVFSRIDENIFAKLYSDIGRPNAPINVLLGLEYIKHMFDYTDDELIDAFYFNYLVSYALGIRVMGSVNIGKRTIYDFRKRLYEYKK